MTGKGEIGLDSWVSFLDTSFLPQGQGCHLLGLALLPMAPKAMPYLYSVPSYLDIIEQAISEGDTLLIENIGETVDPVLDPLLGRNTIKKGR